MPAPSRCRLYLITPPSIADADAFARDLETALSGGDVAALQIRLKDGADAQVAEITRAILPIAQANGVAVIMNDRPDLAASLGCDGVHIGQEDATYDEARRAVGREGIVGVTCHDSRHLAMEASEIGADYVAFGAFFDTATKEPSARAEPEVLTIWQESMVTPCVAIGGITVDNAAQLAAAGADFIAVCSGVWSHPDGPAAAVAALNAEIARGVALRPKPGA
jgi:thiamine-phosphate pyrophosphorylase